MEGTPVCEVQTEHNLEDHISQLPNEVLVDILSLLTLKEVGRSSMLSKRWRDLWKLTANLIFDASALRTKLGGIHNEKIRLRELDAERSKFLTWVNEVVRLHECPSIEEFTVKFDLDATCAHHIDEWVKFVIQKRPQRIDLDLYGFRWGKTDAYYRLSEECCDYIKSVSNLTNLMNLTSVCLVSVNVDGQLLEYLLSNCRNLEMLSVEMAPHVVKLKVAGPSLALKYLRICSCKMTSIELCAPKLERFIYFGQKVKFVVGSNPRLTELDIGGSFRQNMTYALVSFASILSQLETLALRMLWVELCNLDIPEFAELSHLKHLILDINHQFDQELTAFTKFIAAAPRLAKFTMMHGGSSKPIDLYFRDKLVVQPHGCIKEVEIFGFKGCPGEAQMARYLVENCINLEKMVINPVHPEEHIIGSKEVPNRLARIGNDVKVLKERLPPSAELIVVGM